MADYSQSTQKSQSQQNQPLVCQDTTQSTGPKLVSNKQNSSSVPPNGAGGSPMNAAAKDLTSTKGLGSAFCTAAGTAVDALVPKGGDSGKIDLSVQLPIPGTAGAMKAGLILGAEVSRKATKENHALVAGNQSGVSSDGSSNGAKGKVTVKCKLGLVGTVTAGVGWVEAFAQAKVYGFMEATGDSGAECFRLMMMEVERRVRGVPKIGAEVADAVFGGKYDARVKETQKNMDTEDKIATGIGADFSMGFKVDTTNKDSSDVKAGLTYTNTNVTKGDGKGGVTKENEQAVTMGLSVSVPKLGTFTGEAQLIDKGGGKQDFQASLAGEFPWKIEDINLLLGASQYVSSLISQFAGGLTKAGGFNGDGARKAGTMAQFIASHSASGFLATAGANKALKGLAGTAKGSKAIKTGEAGGEVGLRIKLTAGMEGGAGFLSGELSRATTFKFGDDVNSYASLALEQLELIGSFKAGGEKK